MVHLFPTEQATTDLHNLPNCSAGSAFEFARLEHLKQIGAGKDDTDRNGQDTDGAQQDGRGENEFVPRGADDIGWDGLRGSKAGLKVRDEQTAYSYAEHRAAPHPECRNRQLFQRNAKYTLSAGPANGPQRANLNPSALQGQNSVDHQGKHAQD